MANEPHDCKQRKSKHSSLTSKQETLLLCDFDVIIIFSFMKMQLIVFIIVENSMDK